MGKTDVLMTGELDCPEVKGLRLLLELGDVLACSSAFLCEGGSRAKDLPIATALFCADDGTVRCGLLPDAA